MSKACVFVDCLFAFHAGGGGLDSNQQHNAPELHIRRGIEDDSKIIFLVSQ